ncbi:SDR family oxidoreductase [Chitinophaga polysaccharea]|uniref:SDR family oxidoreductase n=1 Tax=Chitinophaga TaxID=79328 RepID=UPI001455A5FA|nr:MULTISPECIES: SDR family oxidoreductase [Chitinophaga]NLR62323.1 SDR family oxidoreductase [Chitinophaga polysaccharea]NLU95779.1 SDR family oxidoreductase [Chitinophaga sp. Ak27]
MAKILVTGATGQLGKVVVDELISNSSATDIAVLVRDPAKAAHWQAQGVTVLQGDYSDYPSLVAAFKGIDKLYFISSNSMTGRIAHHTHVLNAAVAAKVGHVFFTSAHRKTEDGSSPVAFIVNEYLETEKLLKETGITYTLLLHALYADVLPGFLGDKVLEYGMISLPAGAGKAAYATREDLGIAGARLLLSSGHENKSYTLAGNKATSFEELAAIFTALSGKEVKYVAAAPGAFTAQLVQAGVPVEYAQAVTAFAEAIGAGEFDLPDNTLADILGREPESMKNYVAKAFSL